MTVTLKNIQDEVLKPFQNHRQLSIKESEMMTLELLTLLCDDEIDKGSTLKYVAKLITPTTYDDLIEERNLNHLCGYPLCGKPPERNIHHSESALHHGTSGVMASHQNDAIIKRFLWENNPYAYLSKFCSKFHFRCSQFYQVQLDENALFSRTGIHLINDTLKNKDDDENENGAYQVVMFEDLLREKSTEEDVKSLIVGLKKLGLHSSSGDTELSEDKLLEDELSQWLSDIKIVENSNPPLMGDLEKEN
ncbi:similar to Saccharomyces cerevisiae YER139C RTR1 CTD phosphatase [Maudiozyma barnettii]|uniref:RNA polymerase II subunit B1 CTD phosphatase RPAP2 homolog n=1 Tax=Maudiozyma barnettii TaxID=61262 RepID=A0A8H2ZKV0_9SACH|nr:RNA polymerase II subunit B1 CTD phosphatase RTR1 [Kazachstania barnettii]CAB4255532.1 similar to Saccharomyces cerevisiae YER139C RTR1 CTD phosphatase [Kazachstania barnettii]CAD1784031.1 similar to Saccharomyces cerevisiae YER139C RTR1 CTD phosphatase [Kazachstania barnettii]